MDPQPLNALLSEIEAGRPPYTEGIEGLGHWLEQRDLTEGARAGIRATLAEFARIDTFLARLGGEVLRARNTLTELLAAGYPDLPRLDNMEPSVWEEINQNRRTLIAAFGQFSPREITTGGESVVGEQEPTPGAP